MFLSILSLPDGKVVYKLPFQAAVCENTVIHYVIVGDEPERHLSLSCLHPGLNPPRPPRSQIPAGICSHHGNHSHGQGADESGRHPFKCVCGTRNFSSCHLKWWRVQCAICHHYMYTNTTRGCEFWPSIKLYSSIFSYMTTFQPHTLPQLEVTVWVHFVCVKHI